MSTEPTGDAAVAAAAVDQLKDLLADAAVEEEQLELLAPLTAEEMLEAREQLGPEAGRMAVLRVARQNRSRGRPKGARNKRTDDFARYILGFGQDPAITMMQIQSTDPELLIEASKQEKVHSFRKDGTPNVVIERMTYAEAQSLRIRCAENMLSYIHSKKPVAIDATIRGVRIVEEVAAPGDGGRSGAIEGDFVRVAGRLDADLDGGDAA